MYTIIGADGKEYGPVTAEQLRQWIAEGRANAQTRVRIEGSADYRLLGQLTEFFPSLTTPLGAGFAPAPFPVTPLRPNNPMAVTGLVLGILSMTLGCCCYGLPFNIAGIVFSLIALSQINREPANHQGKGMAVAGLVLSILSLLMAVFVFILGTGPHWADFWRKLQRM